MRGFSTMLSWVVPVLVGLVITGCRQPTVSLDRSTTPVGSSMLIEAGTADAETLNPILAIDEVSAHFIDLLYLKLVTLDPDTGAIVPEIAEAWEIAADGRSVDFHLRDDIEWSDGQPLTARDVAFTLNAIASDAVDTPAKSNIELIEKVEIIDDHRLVLHLSTVDCTVLPNLTAFGILPAHVFAEDFSDIMDSPADHAPAVVSGPFLFQGWAPDDHIALARNPRFYKGAPKLAGWIYRVLPDPSAVLTGLLAGEVDLATVEPQYVTVLNSEKRKGQPIEIGSFTGTGYAWLGFNLGDPSQPQRGWEDHNDNGAFDEGEPHLVQAPHPILSDLRVRRAIAQAIDRQGIIDSVVHGQAVPAVANIVPAFEWAFDTTLKTQGYDLAAAADLLDQAGWLDSDGDGIRDKNGRPLALTLLTNSGNEVKASIATVLKDALGKIGFDIRLDIVELGTMADQMYGQTFDMVLSEYGPLPDPEDSALWVYRSDDPGNGSNLGSYYNPELEQLLEEARSVPSCDPTQRGKLYQQVQQVLAEDLPYVFLYVPIENRVWRARVRGIAPGPWSTYRDVEVWTRSP